MSENKTAWKYFSLNELKCKCGKCGSTGLEMKTGFMQCLSMLRAKLDFPFIITSAYRCPEHNNAISKTGKTGPHTTGMAIDIGVRGDKALQLIKEAILIGMTGIGVNQKGDHRFIHLDMLNAPNYPRPNIWSY